ncbi:MAG: alpha/beta hydrolase [Chloroflexi bacterium]|nr:alpha/beta hydrolase [Chloroflexota bacterium]MCC6896778.1 alpha/beta hydrolase [Anaerolineae bacterium]
MATNDFIHRYIPSGTPNAPTLLLLHGTGGNEDALLDIGRQIAPNASLLSPRGKVLENGHPRFFRRLAEGVFDHEDLVARTHELAAFIEAAAGEYGFAPSSLIAVGYSNGANVAASLMLLHPGLLTRAVLLRSMLPFTPEASIDLTGTSVLMLAGRYDNLIPAESVEKLAAVLQAGGAAVDLNWQPTDHRLTSADLQAAQAWITSQPIVTAS